MSDAIPINVNIDADAINKMVSEAIIKSAIGEQIKRTIELKVLELEKGYNNPIAKIVDQIVLTEISTLLSGPLFADRIKAIVSEKLSDEVVARLCNTSWDHTIESIRRLNRDR